ncbi:4076_t:CDS:2, partial [Racocetra persica]
MRAYKEADTSKDGYVEIEEFRQVDKDNDGRINFDDFKKRRKFMKLDNLSNDELKAEFEKIDENRVVLFSLM